MKTGLRFVVALAALCLALPASAADGTLSFRNLSGGGASKVDAPVFDEDGTTRLSGAAFAAQLYVAEQPGGLVAVGVPEPFPTGAAAGYILGGVVSLPGIVGGTRVYVEMRAWETAAGGTYDLALANGGRTGASEMFSVISGNAGAPPTVPASLLGLKSFSLSRAQGVRIVSGPASQVVAVGTAVALTVVAEGDAPLRFQWFKNGGTITGATGPTLSFPSTTLTDTGAYFVRVSNPWSTRDSPAATLTVLIPPGLASQPPPQTVVQGQTLTLQVTATGSGPFQYQWRFKGAAIAGATQPILSVPDFTAAGAGSYTVVVSNPLGAVESAPIAVAIGFALELAPAVGGTVVREPDAAAYPAGTVVRLTAQADDGFVFWGWGGAVSSQLNPLELTLNANVALSAGFTPVNGTVYFHNYLPGAGINAPVLDEDGVTRLAGDSYLAQLYGGTTAENLRAVGRPVAFGTGLQAGYLISDSSLVRAVPPVPLSGVALVQVRAWDSAAGATYEAAQLAGGKAGTSAILSLTTGGGGEPPAVPANLVGLQSFALRRGTGPAILEQPVGGSFLVGQPVSLEVDAGGTPPLAIQWFKGVVELPGATQPALTFDALSPADAGEYHVRVSNAWGEVTSDTINVTVLRHPQAITFPAIPDHVFGDAAFALAASASSGLPVSLAVTAGRATLAGDTLTLTGAGTVQVTATQAGSAEFQPADPVVRSFAVAKASAALALSDLVQVYTGSPRIVTATPTPPGLPVQLTYNGSANAPVNAGTYTVSAVVDHADYQGTASGILVVGKASQLITFGALPAPVFGGAPFAVTATASSGLPVTLALVSGPATLAGGLITATAAGSITLRASQAGNFNHQPAQAETSLTIGKGAAVITLSALTHHYDGLGKAAQSSTEPPGLMVALTYDGGAALPVEAGAHAVRAVVVDANYEGTVAGTLTIGARIRGVVFEDVDGNGRRDAGEAALAGVEVRLFEADGTTLFGATASGADGSFEFVGLGTRTFVIQETDPAGFGSPTPNQRMLNLEGVSEIEVAFGDQRQGTISGLVFYDGNGNRQRDNGEDGLPGVSVTLSTAPARSTTTGADGSYAFTDVPSGSYQVTATDLPGYTSTTPNVRSVTLGADGATASFGDRLAGIVSGAAFEDLNGDGHQDDGEPPLPGVQIRLDGPGGLRQAQTDAGGGYAIAQLVPGTYEVEGTAPSGYLGSTPNRRTVVINESAAATASFGYQRLGSISGVVFDDANGNGQRDLAEPGIGGVLLTLSGGGGADATTRTGAEGSYRFDPPTSGLYTLTEADPAGFVSTTPNLRQVNVGAQSAAVANFGDQAVGRIVGTVFNDLNGNGRQDPDEPGLGGVDVEIIGAISQRLTQTAGNGAYVFDSVEAGAYTVIETDPPDFTSSTPNNRQVTLPAGGSAAVSFGDQQVGTISGLVFDDRNGNGRYDAGEPGISATTVSLGGDGVNTTVRTAGDGSYQFTGLAAGAYTVTETDPAGFASSSENERVVSLAPGGAATVNFGDQPLLTIVGSVFEDQNGNGRHDAGEPGIADVQVELVKAATSEAAGTTVTSATGGFVFADLQPGDYIVRQVVPAGYAIATGNGPALAGPQLLSETAEQAVTLAHDGAASVAFANLVIGSLTGVVFEDVDGGGRLDVGEPGLGGVKVELFVVGQPTPLGTTFTAGDGSFGFTALPAQTYEVRQTTPAGFFCAAPTAGVTIQAGGGATSGFANQRAGAISGRVYHDENSNGAVDVGEPGIGGVSVTLTGGGGLPVVVGTSGDGAFVFTGLVPGAYLLQQTDPEGFSSTTPNEVAINLDPGQAGTASFGDVARPPAPPVLAIQFAAGQPGVVTIVLSGEIGRSYTIEASDAFGPWTPVFTGKAVGGKVQMNDPSLATRPARFYRARFGE